MAPATASFLDGSPDGAAFGDFLRQARERRGLTLQQISSETKIPWRHLDALEHGRLNAVPGGTYRRGEIRAYAEVVGLDKALALERLDRALQASASVASPQTRPSSPGSQRARSLLVVALIALAASLLTVAWNRTAATRSSAPARPEPLPSTRPIAGLVLTPFPIAIAESPAIGEVAPTAVVTQAAPPVRVDTSLRITSEPAGARVTVDGIAWGVTPLTVHHLTPGERRVRVTMPEFASVERSVQMPDDRTSASLHVVLTRTGGR